VHLGRRLHPPTHERDTSGYRHRETHDAPKADEHDGLPVGVIERIHAVTELVEGQKPSTKSAKSFLATLTDRKQVLVVIGRADETSALSVRNLPGVHVISPDQLNTYDVLKADDVVFSVEALNAYIASATKKDEVSA